MRKAAYASGVAALTAASLALSTTPALAAYSESKPYRVGQNIRRDWKFTGDIGIDSKPFKTSKQGTVHIHSRATSCVSALQGGIYTYYVTLRRKGFWGYKKVGSPIKAECGQDTYWYKAEKGTYSFRVDVGWQDYDNGKDHTIKGYVVYR